MHGPQQAILSKSEFKREDKLEYINKTLLSTHRKVTCP